jgi:Flp pilus assembly pilin Flp
VEYGLILTFISVLAIGVMGALGSQVKGTFTTVNSQLSTASTGGTSAAAGGSGSGSGSGSGNNHPGG